MSSDSVWLMKDSTLVSFAGQQLREVQVQRHRYDGKRTMVWMAIAGAATGLALTTACARYESSPEGSGDGCAAVFPGVLVTFGLTGGIFALINHHSATHFLVPADVGSLRPYARFPQGMPDSLAHKLRR